MAPGRQRDACGLVGDCNGRSGFRSRGSHPARGGAGATAGVGLAVVEPCAIGGGGSIGFDSAMASSFEAGLDGVGTCRRQARFGVAGGCGKRLVFGATKSASTNVRSPDGAFATRLVAPARKKPQPMVSLRHRVRTN